MTLIKYVCSKCESQAVTVARGSLNLADDRMAWDIETQTWGLASTSITAHCDDCGETTLDTIQLS